MTARQHQRLERALWGLVAAAALWTAGAWLSGCESAEARTPPTPVLQELVDLTLSEVVSSGSCSPGRVCRSGGLTVSSSSSSCLNVDNGVLFVDCANNRVGVNDSTPSVALDVTGAVLANHASLAYPLQLSGIAGGTQGVCLFSPTGGGTGCAVGINYDNNANVASFPLNAGTTTVFSGPIRPSTDNARTSGASAQRWSNVYSYDLDLADDATVTGDVTISTFLNLASGANIISAYHSSGDFTFSRGALGAGNGDLMPATGSAQNVGAAAGGQWNEGHFVTLKENGDDVLASNNGNNRASLAWSATCFGVCAEDANFQGPLHNVAADATRVGCSWGTAGTGGTTGVVVQVYDVTGAASVCSCTLQACTAAAGTPANCSCTGTLSGSNQYAVRLSSSTDCAGNPSNIVCTVIAEN